MMKIINLIFDGSMTRVAGNPFGRKVYNEQIKDQMDLSTKNKIVFPDTVNGVSISFVQGLMYEIVTERGRSYFKNHFELFSNNEKLNDKLQRSVDF